MPGLPPARSRCVGPSDNMPNDFARWLRRKFSESGRGERVAAFEELGKVKDVVETECFSDGRE